MAADDSFRLAAQEYDPAIPIGALTEHPRNVNEGDVGAIHRSMSAHGMVGGIIVQRSTGRVIAGNHTFRTAVQKGAATLPGFWLDVDDGEAARLMLDMNHSARLGRDDPGLLAALLAELHQAGGLPATYDPEDLDELLRDLDRPPGRTEPDDIPELPAAPVTRPGDLWLLGEHRLLCGDSTDPAAVERVTGGQACTVIHADPPYGMGKESAGVLNDNLYGPRLDAFQQAWWDAWLPALAGNGSAYIWGNAPDLWRWWYGSLSADEALMARNEIVWDKTNAAGMASEERHSYTTATERCLFIMRGAQFLGNQNLDEYWEGYEPLRLHLAAERDKAGWANRQVNRITGTQMAGHWFGRSQFIPISPRHYQALAEAAAGAAFTEDYFGLYGRLFPDLDGDPNAYRRDLAASLRAERTWFDNAHEPMTDVWPFGRVVGEERFGHATPKPVAMAERVLRSSARRGDWVGVPFAGTGPELIAAQHLGRRAAAVELSPAYCDLVCRRFAEHTGIIPARG